jgi:cob(I)alamin adenosyltransferase
MGLLDSLFSSFLEQVDKRDKDLQRYGNSNSQMSPEQKEKLEKSQQQLDTLKKAIASRQNEADELNSKIIGGRTVEQWDRCWTPIGKLIEADLSPFNHDVGLYRHKAGGKVIYIGKATELNNGGLRKRLSDYRRTSDSAREHKSGKIINRMLDKIYTDILIVGSTQSAVEITEELEKAMIQKYSHLINVQYNR